MYEYSASPITTTSVSIKQRAGRQTEFYSEFLDDDPLILVFGVGDSVFFMSERLDETRWQGPPAVLPRIIEYA
jgi:hypothetical protein